MGDSFDILYSFGPLFFILFGLFLLILVAASLLLRHRSQKTKTAVLVAACVVTFVGFFVYKYFLYIDADYDRILKEAGEAGFNWWNELPFHLCNVNMILIPIAVLTKKKPLLSFCFFLAPLGAMLALLLPATGFDGYSIFLPRMLGYYGTHFMIVIEGLAIVTFGFYRPKFRDLPKTMAAMAALALGAFLISWVLRAAGLSSDANYFFTWKATNAPLELFWSLIPLPYLYLLPAILVLGVYAGIITGGFRLADRGKGKKTAEAPKAGTKTK